MQNSEPAKKNHTGSVSSCTLAVLSDGCDYAAILKKSAAMSAANGTRLIAIYVNPAKSPTPAQKQMRQDAMIQARQFGARTSVTEGNDPAKLIAEFASLYHASNIVLGSSAMRAASTRFEASLIRRLQQELPYQSFTLVTESDDTPAISSGNSSDDTSLVTDFLTSMFVMAAATVFGFFMAQFGLSEVSLIPVYSLAVLIVSLVCSSWKSGIIASVVSIFLYNFLFAQPRMNLQVANAQNLFIYLVMLVTSIAIGLLVTSMKNHIANARRNAYKTRLLFDTNELMQLAGSDSEIIDILCQQSRLLSFRSIVYYTWDGVSLSEPRLYPLMSMDPPNMRTLAAEKEMAKLAAANGELTGAGSLTPGNASFLYLPVKTSERTLGVLGVEMQYGSWEDLESDVLQAMITKSALTMENMLLAHEMEEARIQAKNEETRSNLLRMISHDLRTPLTSILGNISNLMLDKNQLDESSKDHIYKDIYSNTTWLIKLVENLLSASRMEEGSIQVKTSPDILEEAVNEAVKTSIPLNPSHVVNIRHDEDFILADIDAGMLIRAIANLLDNAQQYSPPGSVIDVHTWTKDGVAFVDVSDQGPGIDDEVRGKMFQMFYSGNKVSADSKKNLGLGLFLAQQIVESHNGTLTHENLPQGGSRFSIAIPLSDLSMLHE